MATKRSLSKNEADLVLAWEWEKRRLVSLKDIIKRLRCSSGYACKIAHALRKKGWLESVSRGHYLLIGAERGPRGVPEMNPYMVARLFPRSYFFAYRFACAHHGLLTQIPHVIHVAVTRQKQPFELKNVRFEFVALSERRFFGFQEATVMGEKVNVADLERSALDAVDHPELVGGIEAAAQALSHAGKKLDPAMLLDYLKRYDDSALSRRVGYLCELLRVGLSKPLVGFLRGQVARNPAYLGSPSRWGKEGKHEERWNLILNVPREELLGEVRIG
jgi:predicted transcriptional regulator of viral defense system